MTTSTDNATYLLGLPPEVLAQLARIAREAAEMTSEERGYAAALFSTVALHFGHGHGLEQYVPGAQMVSALGVLLRHTDDIMKGA